MTVTKNTLHQTAWGTAAFAFIVYLITLAPSLDFIDAGELATVAYTFGVAHPTGYPLFTMLGGLWSHIPLGSVIYRMNLFSAVCSSVAIAFYVYLIWFLIQLQDKKKMPVPAKAKAKNGQTLRPQPQLSEGLRLVVAVFGALVIALSETYWKTALAVEVYPLHVLMLSIVLNLFVRAVLDTEVAPVKQSKFFFLFAFLFGLSFTNHMTTILLFPAFIVAYFQRFRFGAQSWKRIGMAIPVFFAGLLPYLYLPLRGAMQPVMNWGYPVNLERFFWHISGKQYRVWIFSSMDAAKKQFVYFLSSYAGEFAYFALAFILIGVVYAFRRQKRVGWFLIMLFIGCLSYSINYDIHDIDSYFLLSYIASAIWAAYGLYAVLMRLKSEQFRTGLAIAGVSALAMLGVLFGRVSERGNYLVEDYTRNMFNCLKPNALVLSYQWDYWVSASFYMQQVEHCRPDVVIIDKELLRRSWYLIALKKNHPEIYRRSQREIELFSEELTKFEHDDPYESAIIEKRYNDMIASFVEKNYDDRPVYMTIEIEQHLAPDFDRVPEGLAFRLYRKGMPPQINPVWDNFTYRPLDGDDRLIVGLKGIYPAMLANRGVYIQKYGMLDEGETYLKRALVFNPRDAQIQNMLIELQERIAARNAGVTDTTQVK